MSPHPSPFTTAMRPTPPPPLVVPPNHTSLRLLCRSSLIGHFIGKSGTSIKNLQTLTSSKIRVQDPLHPNSDHRIILIIASNSISPSKTLKFDEFGDEFEVSVAQEAVIRVFERVLEVEGVEVGLETVVLCRLVVDVDEAGSLIGKGGKIVEKIRKECGVKIRVLVGDHLPSGVSSADEVVEIEGNTLAVKKALFHVCGRLQECHQGEYSSIWDRRPLESTSQPAALDLCVESLQRIAVSAAPTPSGPALVGRPLSSEVDNLRISNSMSQPQDFVFRILCSNDRAGGVIGRGGSIIRALENETGASINFGPKVANSNERLVTIISKEDVESRYSPAQHAVILLFSRSVEVGVEIGLEAGLDKGSSISAKIVVPSKQASSLLCRRGVVFSQMRKETGAGISIVRGDQVPRCCSEDDGVIEISGHFANVRDALLQVTGRLQSNPFANKVMNIPRSCTNTSLRSDPSLRAKVVGPSSMGFQQSSGSSQHIDRQAHRRPYLDPLLHPCKLGNSHSPKFQIQNPEMKGSVNTRISTNSDSVLTSANGVEVASANGPAIVNDTTKEILVPEGAINSVYGENGNNLARIRQISGAEVVVHEAHTGSTDRTITISGTPSKTQAAESLLHAFILTGSL